MSSILSQPWTRIAVVVPHKDLCRPFSEHLTQALLTAGIIPNTVLVGRVDGENFHVNISPPHEGSVKGGVWNGAYLPPQEELSKVQVKGLSEIRSWLIPIDKVRVINY